jgi:hypothetical protein
MQRFTKYLAGAAALGALASPAAAQYYPQQPYQQQYQQPYQQQYQQPYAQGYAYGQQGYNQNPIGAIIDSLLGNRYNVTDRQAVSRCASAAVAQAQSQYGGRYNGYGNNGYNRYQGQGYNNGMALRVTSITDVQRRNNGLRVSGMLSPGGSYNHGYNQGYGQLSFRCNVDYNGAVSGVRIGRG